MDNPGKVKISAAASLLAGTMRLLRLRSIFWSKVRNPVRNKKGFVSKGLLKKYSVETVTVNSKEVVTFEKIGKVDNKHIIYLHGGSWTFEATKMHWMLTREIVEASSCRMSMVDYPLAPEYSYRETLQMVQNTYLMLTEKYVNDHFILMGDSAGGNIALAMVQKLIHENFQTLPIRNILFSPAVDLTFTNPEMKEVARLDYILTRELVLFGAAQYANGDDLHHYLLSPINGALEQLPDTDIFYGTHEILMPDILRLKTIAEKAGARIHFHEYEGMQHDWVLFPIPERQKTIEEVIRIIAKL